MTHKSDLPEAHEALAAQYRKEHEAAEEAHDAPATVQAELRLVEHTESLPAEHPDRADHFAYLKGDGALSLLTSEPGAEVLLEKYVVHNRRLVAESVKMWTMGSVLDVEVHDASGEAEVKLPRVAFQQALINLLGGNGFLGQVGEDSELVWASGRWVLGMNDGVEIVLHFVLWTELLQFPARNPEYI